MKIFSTFILFLLGFSLMSQTYILDNSFGTNGLKTYAGIGFTPFKGILLNNNYYLVSTTSIGKINYNGDLVTSFGVNGYMSSPFSIKDIKVVNNAIYISGYITVNSTNDNIVIWKLDENGNADTSFGANGMATIDFGDKEDIGGYIFEPSGKLFCTGKRGTNLIYFRLHADGNIDTTFDSNGYKSYISSSNTNGVFITPYNGGYLMVSNFVISAVESLGLIIKIDVDGNLDSTYGINGTKTMPIPNNFFISLNEEHEYYDNKLFLKINRTWVSSYLIIYDLTSDTILANTDTGYMISHSQSTDTGIYISGYSSCGSAGSSPTACFSNRFNLRKILLDGTLDASFQNNTIFEYNFTYTGEPLGLSISRLFIRDNNGDFLIAGNHYVCPGCPKFVMLRLTEGALGVSDNYKNNVVIEPNPVISSFSLSGIDAIQLVEIFDLAGKKVHTENSNFNNITISSLNSGIYIVKVKSNSTVSTLKLIKK